MDIRTANRGDPILDQFGEEGFVDLTFRIRNLVKDRKQYRLHLSAAYGERTVGMDVVLLQGIQGCFDANMDLVKRHVYRQGVRFMRAGAESDRLISAIGELYGSEGGSRRMIDEETFTAIALHQGKLDMDREPVKLKLFGRDVEPFDEDAYYESFFNVDLPNGFVYWNEKDSDYRKALLGALSVS